MVRFVEKLIGREDLRGYLYTFLSPETALVFEVTCKDAKSNDAYWAGLVDRILVYSGPSETRLYRESGEVDSKGLFRALQIVSAESKINSDEEKRQNLNFLPSHFKVRGCSSVDRREESPLNVQRPSFCHEMIMKLGFHGLSIPEGEIELNEHLSPMAKLQIQCGCATDRPCYYCTKACDNNDAREWIDMCRSDRESAQGTLMMQLMGSPAELRNEGDLVCVAAFSLVVYRCYLQSGGPIFAPRAVQLQLWQGLDARDGKSSSRSRLCFESEEFPVQMHEEEQTFELSEPVFLPHSMIEGGEEAEFTIRLMLLGAQQRQTVPGALDYYVCLSQVKLLGSSMQHIVRSEWRRSRSVSSSSAAAVDREDYDVNVAAQRRFLAGIKSAKFSSRAVCQSDNHALRRGKTRINEFRK